LNQITPAQVTQALKSLFDLDMPTGIRCQAVLAGGNAGKILTDDPDQPNYGLVWERDDGTLYRGGEVSAQNLALAVTLLRQEDTVALGYRDGDADVQLFPPNPDASATCLEFERPIHSSDLSPFLEDLPRGYALQRMDSPLLESSPHFESTVRRYGSIENFLSRGIAVCIRQGEKFVCEAYADMEIMGKREMGVTTQTAYQDQGFATLTCAHLIKLCEDSGSSTYWDCAQHNPASIAVARKLGFGSERRYHLVAWFKPQLTLR
jgi:RimJ/RimL family protein N-acetyltransferase